MSVTPVSDYEVKTTPNEAFWQASVSRPRPAGLTPIIMSGWVTPSENEENEDIENSAKKRIKVCDVYTLPYAQKCVLFDDGTNGTNSTNGNAISDVKLFVEEAERVREAKETCAMAAAILKRY